MHRWRCRREGNKDGETTREDVIERGKDTQGQERRNKIRVEKYNVRYWETMTERVPEYLRGGQVYER